MSKCHPNFLGSLGSGYLGKGNVPRTYMELPSFVVRVWNLGLYCMKVSQFPMGNVSRYVIMNLNGLVEFLVKG